MWLLPVATQKRQKAPIQKNKWTKHPNITPFHLQIKIKKDVTDSLFL